MTCVREATPEDVPALLTLMRNLAAFEDYLDAFAVTEQSLHSHGFGSDRLFTAHVAVGNEVLIGMAITYVIPWTYTMRPKLVLKELFVVSEARGSGAGRHLMSAVASEARFRGCGQILWTVMTGNTAAEHFYRAQGGRPDDKWNNWVLDLD